MGIIISRVQSCKKILFIILYNDYLSDLNVVNYSKLTLRKNLKCEIKQAFTDQSLFCLLFVHKKFILVAFLLGRRVGSRTI